MTINPKRARLYNFLYVILFLLGGNFALSLFFFICKLLSEFIFLRNIFDFLLRFQHAITSTLLVLLCFLFLYEMFYKLGKLVYSKINPFTIRRFLQQSLKDSVKSLYWTYRMRKFCKFSTSNTIVDTQQGTNEKNRKNANHSLRTLVVEFFEDEVIFTVRLPLSHEAKRLWIDNLDDIKGELNHISSDIRFNDITHENRSQYTAKAKRIQ